MGPYLPKALRAASPEVRRPMGPSAGKAQKEPSQGLFCRQTTHYNAGYRTKGGSQNQELFLGCSEPSQSKMVPISDLEWLPEVRIGPIQSWYGFSQAWDVPSSALKAPGLVWATIPVISPLSSNMTSQSNLGPLSP